MVKRNEGLVLAQITNSSINKSFRVKCKQLKLLDKLIKEKGESKSYWVREGINLILKREGMIGEHSDFFDE